jgi:hypothetical protein
MNLYRPPQPDLWQHHVNMYEKNFRKRLPEWVVTLDRNEGITLMQVCIRLHWRLPTIVIPRGEYHQGDGGLWGSANTIWDRDAKPLLRPNFDS